MLKNNAGRLLLPVAAILSFAHAIQFMFFEVFNPLAIDYAVFSRISNLPIDQVYASAGDHPFVNPPTSLIFFKPLALIGAPYGFFIWSWLSLSTYLLVIKYVAGLRNAIWSVCAFSAISALTLGQATLILGSFLLLAFALPAFSGGIFLGLVLAVKPQLALLAPLALIARRDWRMLAGTTIAIAVSIALELLLFGPELWLQWLHSIPQFQKILIGDDVIRFVITPAGMAEAFGLPSPPFLLAGATIGVCTLLLFAKQLEGLELAALVSAASILSVPYSLPHDMVAIVPACVAVISRARPLAMPAIGVFASIFPGFWIALTMILYSVILLKNRVTGASLFARAGTSQGQSSDDI